MSSRANEMEIEFLNQRIKLTLPQKYSEFKDLLKETFWLSEERSKNITILYNNDGDEVELDEDEYESRNARDAKYWILNEEDDDDDDDNTDIMSRVQTELENKRNDILNEAKKFKETLLANYKEKLAEKKKEINSTLQENVKKIKDEYAKSLKEMKDELKAKAKEIYGKIKENIIKKYEENIKEVNDECKKNMVGGLQELTGEFKSDLEKVSSNEITNDVNILGQSLRNCKSTFEEKLDPSKSKAKIHKLKIENVEVQKNTTEVKEGFKLKLPIENLTTEKLKENNYIISIVNTNDDKEVYSIKIDLSDLPKKTKMDREVKFNPKISKNGNYKYNIRVQQDNNIVSNEAILTLKVSTVGDMDDLMN